MVVEILLFVGRVGAMKIEVIFIFKQIKCNNLQSGSLNANKISIRCFL